MHACMVRTHACCSCSHAPYWTSTPWCRHSRGSLFYQACIRSPTCLSAHTSSTLHPRQEQGLEAATRNTAARASLTTGATHTMQQEQGLEAATCNTAARACPSTKATHAGGGNRWVLTQDVHVGSLHANSTFSCPNHASTRTLPRPVLSRSQNAPDMCPFYLTVKRQPWEDVCVLVFFVCT